MKYIRVKLVSKLMSCLLTTHFSTAGPEPHKSRSHPVACSRHWKTTGSPRPMLCPRSLVPNDAPIYG